MVPFCGRAMDPLWSRPRSASENICAATEFRRTPPEMRTLIQACTLGAPEWEGRRQGLMLPFGKLIPLETAFTNKINDVTARDVVEIAREWWQREISRGVVHTQGQTGRGKW
jgi:hypothetical protein